MDKDSVLIGIDAGTSVIKSVAFSAQGEQLAVAALPNHYETRSDGGAEQDMARTWADAARSLAMLCDQVPGLAKRAVAIGVTGQGDGTWLVDKAGEPLAPAWLWLDSRAAGIVDDYMRTDEAAAHYARTGTGINACQQSAQLAWIKRHAPSQLARAASVHHCKDWLYFKLTGERAADPSEANFTFGDFRSRSYAPQVLDDLGAGEAKQLLPEIVNGTQVSHGLSGEAARLTGLPVGLPVCLGYVDVICSGMGGGLFDLTGKSGCTIVGSTGMHMVMRQQDEVRLNAERSGYTMCVPQAGHVAQIQSNMASTLNIDWLLDLALDVLAQHGITRSRRDLLAGLDDKVLAEAPGRVIYHPYISLAGERGPFLEAAARASFTGLEVGVGYSSLMRGVFEGIALAARDCYDAIGGAPQEVRVTGGAVKSHALRLMLASALHTDVRVVDRPESGALGAAMIAAVQQGLYSDMASVAVAWVEPHLGPATAPDETLSKIYDGLFPVYRNTRVALRDNWRAHAALKRT